MDLNQLLHRHQVSLACAKAASCPEARVAHEGLAKAYAVRLEAVRVLSGATFPLTACAA